MGLSCKCETTMHGDGPLLPNSADNRFCEPQSVPYDHHQHVHQARQSLEAETVIVFGAVYSHFQLKHGDDQSKTTVPSTPHPVQSCMRYEYDYTSNCYQYLRRYDRAQRFYKEYSLRNTVLPNREVFSGRPKMFNIICPRGLALGQSRRAVLVQRNNVLCCFCVTADSGTEEIIHSPYSNCHAFPNVVAQGFGGRSATPRHSRLLSSSILPSSSKMAFTIPIWETNIRMGLWSREHKPFKHIKNTKMNVYKRQSCLKALQSISLRAPKSLFVPNDVGNKT
jgi:hypothetical protein